MTPRKPRASLSIFSPTPTKKADHDPESAMENEATQDNPEMLPGMTPKLPIGKLEAAVNDQVQKLRDLGFIEQHHAGLVELALVTARDIDHSVGRGAPSGRANLLRVMNEILEGMPQPAAASRDALDDVVRAMKDDIETGEHAVRART